MSESSAVATFGTQVKLNGTAVAELLNADGPDLSHNPVDVTNHDSTGGYREFIGSEVIDAGQSTFLFNRITANYQALRGVLGNQTPDSWEIVWPDGGSFACDGVLTGLNFGAAEIEGKQTIEATIKWSGQPDFNDES